MAEVNVEFKWRHALWWPKDEKATRYASRSKTFLGWKIEGIGTGP